MPGWLASLVGGGLIGLAATGLLWANGRIAGVSGIVDNLVKRTPASEWRWRAAFVAGLVIAGGLAMHLSGTRSLSPYSAPVLIVAGLFVGFGTTLGGGCTSGHGVCGIGRMSKRSLVSTVVFVGTAMLTVFIVRHVLS